MTTDNHNDESKLPVESAREKINDQVVEKVEQARKWLEGSDSPQHAITVQAESNGKMRNVIELRSVIDGPDFYVGHLCYELEEDDEGIIAVAKFPIQYSVEQHDVTALPDENGNAAYVLELWKDGVMYEKTTRGYWWGQQDGANIKMSSSPNAAVVLNNIAETLTNAPVENISVDQADPSKLSPEETSVLQKLRISNEQPLESLQINILGKNFPIQDFVGFEVQDIPLTLLMQLEKLDVFRQQMTDVKKVIAAHTVKAIYFHSEAGNWEEVLRLEGICTKHGLVPANEIGAIRTLMHTPPLER